MYLNSPDFSGMKLFEASFRVSEERASHVDRRHSAPMGWKQVARGVVVCGTPELGNCVIGAPWRGAGALRTYGDGSAVVGLHGASINPDAE